MLRTLDIQLSPRLPNASTHVCTGPTSPTVRQLPLTLKVLQLKKKVLQLSCIICPPHTTLSVYPMTCAN